MADYWTEDDIQAFYRRAYNWLTDGTYDFHIAKINSQIEMLEYFKALAQNMPTLLKEGYVTLTVIHSKNINNYPLGRHDVSGAPLNTGAIWIDCSGVRSVGAPGPFVSTDTVYSANIKRDAWAKQYYDYDPADYPGDTPRQAALRASREWPCAYRRYDEVYGWIELPETVWVDINYQALGTSIIIARFSAKLKGNIDPSGSNFDIICDDVNVYLYGFDEWISTSLDVRFVFGSNVINFISYPSDVRFSTGKVAGIELNKIKIGKLYLNVKNKSWQVPSVWGATIVPITTVVYGGDTYITNYGGFARINGVEYANSRAWQTRVFPNDPQATLNPFAFFARFYGGHPLVTGVDIYTAGTCPLSDLLEVNTLVNTDYTYEYDYLKYRGEKWKIMNAAYPFGDCEDFAVTKADMLLKRGWPISSLHLHGGFQRHIGTDGFPDYQGHLWLEVVVENTTYVLDNLSNPLRTVAEMIDAEDGYPEFQVYQRSGLVWDVTMKDAYGMDVKYERYTVKLPTDSSFDVPLMTFDTSIKGSYSK